MEKSCLTCEFGKSEKRPKGYYCNHPKMIKRQTGPDGEECWYNTQSPCGSDGWAYKPRKEKEMDRQAAIINHRHMWNWLSENPEKKGRRMDKSDYMYKFNIDPIPYDRCFLCEYHYQSPIDLCGNTCILEWPDPGGCSFPDKLFGRWNTESDPSRRAELARQIRDLPKREEKRMVGVLEGLGTPKTVVIEGAAINALNEYMRAPETPNDWLEGARQQDPKTFGEPKTPPPPKLTRAEAIAKTREQWRWYANNPTMDKEAYFINKGIPYEDRPYMLCYVCEWTKEGRCVTLPNCGERCPLEWPGGCCELKGVGLFEMWSNNTDNLDLRISIAALISRLPEA